MDWARLRERFAAGRARMRDDEECPPIAELFPASGFSGSKMTLSELRAVTDSTFV